ncbi:HD domain-containing phosphohydrolase [Aromatoleum sp.]|uniref:HD domain-containing phosphohydrolase n=1 Tax=Aromatoleum sp. TaxID=2307007 RepID=UPI002FCC15AC
MLAVGGVTAWVSYSRGSRILEASAVELAMRSTGEAGGELERVLAPARSAVRLLALQPVASAGTLAERMEGLAFFAEALRLTDTISAYYVGYPDGDFFLVRRIAAGAEAQFDAPRGTRFVVQSIERGGGAAESRFIFLDEALARLGAAPRPQALAFDPRVRPWYEAAMNADGVARTDPYVFFTTGKIGNTVAVRTADGRAVVAADVELDTLSAVLARQRITPGTRLVLFDDGRRLMGSGDPDTEVIVREADGSLRPAVLAELGQPSLAALAGIDVARLGTHAEPAVERVRIAGEDLMLTLARLRVDDRRPAFLGLAIPTDELLGEARALRNQALAAAAALLALAVPLALWLAYVIARPLARLAGEAEAVRRFEFDRPIAVRSWIREVDELALTLDQMKDTLARFLRITAEVAAEADFERLLPQLLDETARAVGADSGVLYLVGNDPDRLCPAAGLHLGARVDVDATAEVALDAAAPFELATAIRERRPVTRPLREGEWEHAVPAGGAPAGELVIALPLFSREQALVGALVLLTRGGADPARLAFIGALSGFAAVSLETRGLIRAQKALFDAFLRLLAGAIDAKSPYTGGHCARVPELATMLAEAACEATEGPYRDFQLDADEREAVHIAAWLHDCGKVTTPEYVVDKATKLENLYDRIHEVRMRFEVAKREAEVACWRAIAEGEARATALTRLEAAWRELDDDFAFVARCNVGGESMTTAEHERLHAIGRRTWTRTIDDRLGVGHDELARMNAVARAPLPVAEPLLADKPEHRIPRRESERFGEGNPWGFRMKIPALLYDRGELHNLTVGRGTLTEEERYKINEHIIQTIVMLSALPFPRHLTAVPEYAGGHHETMDGTGYPRRLTGEMMSPAARMLAIADIFEALTAIDRPYKPGKTLSETLTIMARMRNERHIDPELFELFLRAGVFRRYAERFMQPEQIDEVDIERYLGGAAAV